VTTLANARGLGREWAISDGNAGAEHTTFSGDINSLKALNWTAIRATQWQGLTHEKSAEFLVADFFEWSAIIAIGCHNDAVKLQLEAVHHKHARRHLFALRGPDSPLKLRYALLAQKGRHSCAMELIGNRQCAINRFLTHSLSSQRPPVCRELVRINGRRIAVRFQSIRVVLVKTVT
jgi:hypothetical protein